MCVMNARSNQAIRTRLENGLDAGRFRGKFRVIPRYSAAESGAECAELRFRPFVHPRPRYSTFGRADSALGCSGRDPRPNSLVSVLGRLVFLAETELGEAFASLVGGCVKVASWPA